MTLSNTRLALLLPMALIAAACAHEKPATPAPEPAATTAEAPAAAPAPKATHATVAAAGKGKVSGTVRFVPEGNMIHVIADIRGLKPRTEHGFHVHDNGECTGPKFETAGGHYNPLKTAHGGPHSDHRHLGDLGNLNSDKSGHATLDDMIPQSPSNDTFVGRAVIIHAKTDDLKSQPTGDAGDRVACGVISEETP